jgi:hypothetical protein
MRSFFSRPVPLSRGAIIVAVIALCAAIGGGAYAKNNLGKGAVQAKNIAPGAIAKKVKVIEVAGPTVKADSLKSVSTSIACPTGTVAISGEASVVDPTNTVDDAAIEASFRSSNQRSWTFRFDNAGPVAHQWATSVLCLKVT